MGCILTRKGAQQIGTCKRTEELLGLAEAVRKHTAEVRKESTL